MIERHRRSIKRIAPFVPYAVVMIGLLWLKNAWAAVLGFHAALFVILLIEKPPIPVAALFRSKAPAMLIGCVILSASSGFFLYLAWPLMGAPGTISADLAALGLTASSWPAFIGYFTMINPWIEEYFWRGYLGNSLKSPAWIDIVFAGYHVLVIYDKIQWMWTLSALLCLTFAGWFFRQVTRGSGGLLVSSLSHMAADFSILTAVYLILKEG